MTDYIDNNIPEPMRSLLAALSSRTAEYRVAIDAAAKARRTVYEAAIRVYEAVHPIAALLGEAGQDHPPAPSSGRSRAEMVRELMSLSDSGEADSAPAAAKMTRADQLRARLTLVDPEPVTRGGNGKARGRQRPRSDSQG